MIKFFRKKREISSVARQLITETDFVVVDTELTGLNEFRDNIIAIGAIKMKGRTIKIGELFYRTVSPSTKKFRKESIMIHEITPSELAKCPEIKPILKEFIKFSSNSIIVGHCIDLDLAFLRREIRKNLEENFDPLYIDTLAIYKWLINKEILPSEYLNKNSLEEIALSLYVEIKELHDALSDAFITAQIFQILMAYLGEIKVQTIGELIGIGKLQDRYFNLNLKKESYQF